MAIDLSEGCDPAVKKNTSRILKELQLEEERFSATLGTGQKLLTDILQVCGHYAAFKALEHKLVCSHRHLADCHRWGVSKQTSAAASLAAAVHRPSFRETPFCAHSMLHSFCFYK